MHMVHNQYNLSKHKYHYFYKITNNITGQYYYGIHSTNDLNDGYMGSGSAIHRDIRKLGKEYFTKTIIKMFDTRDEASNYENEVVTKEVINDINCYNMKTGGDYGLCVDTVLCFDTRTGEMLRSKLNDPLYLNGTYINFMTNKVPVYDIIDKIRKVISCDEYKKHKERYLTSVSNRVTVKDKNGNTFSIKKGDERLKTGEFVSFWKGRKHTNETKQKISDSKKGSGVGKNNSQYGKCWITKNCINKSIKKEELQKYLNEGWIKGKYEKWSNADVLYMDYNILKRDKEHLSWKEMEEKYKCDRQTLRKYISQCN